MVQGARVAFVVSALTTDYVVLSGRVSSFLISVACKIMIYNKAVNHRIITKEMLLMSQSSS